MKTIVLTDKQWDVLCTVLHDTHEETFECLRSWQEEDGDSSEIEEELAELEDVLLAVGSAPTVP